MTTTNATTAEIPHILRLSIRRFRGIESLVWYPNPGVNVVLGGGDTGKTTLLEAIALLLGPTNSAVLSDTDYWNRLPEQEFEIEAVMRLPASTGINDLRKHSWPWGWDGTALIQPDPENEVAGTDAVFVVRARGSSESDLIYEICQPNGENDHFPATVRRKIGLVKLTGDDRNDRDLRLIQGSALDRYLADKLLRSKLAKQLGEENVEDHLSTDAKSKLNLLSSEFENQTLPSNLGLGLVGGNGFSLNALIGLTAKKSVDVRLPLSSWGSGTRRLASLEVAAANHLAHPITIVDEIERGLEPYRQRALVADILKTNSQTFVTTHSSVSVSAASDAALWYFSDDQKLGRLSADLGAHIRKDPEAFLSRLTIVAEGVTECGFIDALLRRSLGDQLLNYGICITDAGGNDTALAILESLSKAGLRFGGFVDDEGRFPTRWQTLKSSHGSRLLQWSSGCLEENVIRHVIDGDLERFIGDADGHSGERLRTLADRLNADEKTFSSLRSAAPNIKQLIVEAATGYAPEDLSSETRKAWKSHGRRWFKSLSGGPELERKMFEFGVWPMVRDELLPFVNSVRAVVGLDSVTDLQ